MSPRAALAAAALLLLACSAGTSQGPAAQPSPTVPSTPLLIGTASLVWSSYGRTEGTGYDPVAIFEVRNPSDSWLLAVPYKVEQEGPNGPLSVSEDSPTFPLRPHETRLVVSTTGSTVGVAPISAKVTIYTPTSWVAKGTAPPPYPDPAKLRYQHVLVDCNTGFVQCRVTADLTWTGSQPIQPHRVAAIIRKGSDAQGGIIAAGGSAPGDSPLPNLLPNQPAPIELHVQGNQSKPEGGGDQSVIQAGVTTELLVD